MRFIPPEKGINKQLINARILPTDPHSDKYNHKEIPFERPFDRMKHANIPLNLISDRNRWQDRLNENINICD
jgi:hypothetical protein